MELERDVKELRRASDILKTASAVLRRRSSTAGSNREGLHRPSPRGLWGRAELNGAADGPVMLLVTRGTAMPARVARPPGYLG